MAPASASCVSCYGPTVTRQVSQRAQLSRTIRVRPTEERCGRTLLASVKPDNCVGSQSAIELWARSAHERSPEIALHSGRSAVASELMRKFELVKHALADVDVRAERGHDSERHQATASSVGRPTYSPAE